MESFDWVLVGLLILWVTVGIYAWAFTHRYRIWAWIHDNYRPTLVVIAVLLGIIVFGAFARAITENL